MGAGQYFWDLEALGSSSACRVATNQGKSPAVSEYRKHAPPERRDDCSRSCISRSARRNMGAPCIVRFAHPLRPRALNSEAQALSHRSGVNDFGMGHWSSR